MGKASYAASAKYNACFYHIVIIVLPAKTKDQSKKYVLTKVKPAQTKTGAVVHQRLHHQSIALDLFL